MSTNQSEVLILDHSIAYKIRRLSRLLRIELNRVLADSPGNLTAEQWIILLQLQNQHDVYQHELTDVALQDRANITRHLNNLEDKGYIFRRQDNEDARRNFVSLTDAGNAVIELLTPIISKLRLQRYAGISQEEMERMITVMKKIEQNIINEDTNGKP